MQGIPETLWNRMLIHMTYKMRKQLTATDELRHRSNEERVWAYLYGLSLHRYQSCVPICVTTVVWDNRYRQHIHT